MTLTKTLKTLSLLAASSMLSSCLYNMSDVGTSSSSAPTPPKETTSAEEASQPVKLNAGGPLGGYIEQFMDANDKSKMARALDGGVGKASRWTNPVSGAQFAVTPTAKVSIGGGICRTYVVSMIKGGIADKASGTACIGDDGVWHSAG